MPTSVNDTFIFLIPKTKSPETITQYRSISLCNTIYKIISKILVRRLRPHLSDLISSFQSSFIPGRRASDNVIILREVIHSFRKRKGRMGNFIVKLDLEKAFDRLEWCFICKVLTHFKFPKVWIEWLMACVSSTSTSILFNGSCLESFIPSRGIRQGDPISPCIFILCMDYLLHLIEDKVDLQAWRGIRRTCQSFPITHLLFVDDILLMGTTSTTSISSVKFVLDAFCEESGMRINLNKSKLLFSKNTSPAQRLQACSVFSIQETTDLGKYLGFPISLSLHKEKDFTFVLEKVRAKLTGWKSNLLSMGLHRQSSLESLFFSSPLGSSPTMRTQNLISSGHACASLHNASWECPPSWGHTTDAGEKESPLTVYDPKVKGR
ncbi:hypothetical protein CRG98_029401 [Punica granatum]|uniref:Reverse transcriptase domain-containing protein n=1 Tax=Punica granatum TaxID=22663 RepID=A0A2I0J1V7_PUNGR|nr:hypothetical protein CRG98_029401 [Punica granatum]